MLGIGVYRCIGVRTVYRCISAKKRLADPNPQRYEAHLYLGGLILYGDPNYKTAACVDIGHPDLCCFRCLGVQENPMRQGIQVELPQTIASMDNPHKANVSIWMVFETNLCKQKRTKHIKKLSS